MIFLLPIAAAVTVGEAIGIGVSIAGIGAGVKGALDYRKAKKLKAEADEQYRTMVLRIKKKAESLKKSLEHFGRLKHEAYTVVIRNAVKVLSPYKSIDLSAYKTVSVENISFMNAELAHLDTACIKASDVLSSISAGISTAFHDTIPYKDTPILIENIGIGGWGKHTKGLPFIPYAGITMAGISWGMSGNLSRTKAEAIAAEAYIEIENMKKTLSALKAMHIRVKEGEALLYGLSDKLRKTLLNLSSLTEHTDGMSDEAAKEIDTALSLVKSIKQIIETDICDAHGVLTRKSGIVFHKIEKEVQNV